MDQAQLALQAMQMMNSVVAEMKEIPVLPSEEPKDVSPLQRVEFPKDGGVLTYMEGQEYPYKGFPLDTIVDKIDLFKKFTRNALSGFYHSLKHKNRLWLLTLIPAAWMFKSVIRAVIYTFYRIMERTRIKSIRYSDSMRELYRAFSKENSELRLQLRDMICMILEFDNAYRFRFQDISAEIDKDRLQKKPVKELLRLFEIAQSREKDQYLKDTWTLFKLLIRIYFRLDKEMLFIVQDVLLDLDVEKTKLDEGDKSYCIPRSDYNFGFMLQISEEDKAIIERTRLSRKKVELRNKVREES